jgi:hypothetical protein
MYMWYQLVDGATERGCGASRILLTGSLLRRVRVLGLKPSDAHHFAHYLAHLPPKVAPTAG